MPPRRAIKMGKEFSASFWCERAAPRRGAKSPLRGVLRPLLQSLQYVRTILAPIKPGRLGEPTVQNLRQPDHRPKIVLGPFRHHAVEYFLAAMPPPRAIKMGKEVLSELLV
jgi:hypothetical protein